MAKLKEQLKTEEEADNKYITQRAELNTEMDSAVADLHKMYQQKPEEATPEEEDMLNHTDEEAAALAQPVPGPTLPTQKGKTRSKKRGYKRVTEQAWCTGCTGQQSTAPPAIGCLAGASGQETPAVKKQRTQEGQVDTHDDGDMGFSDGPLILLLLTCTMHGVLSAFIRDMPFVCV